MKKSVLRKRRAEIEKQSKINKKRFDNTKVNKEQDIPVLEDKYENVEKERKVFNPFFDLSKKKSSDE